MGKRRKKGKKKKGEGVWGKRGEKEAKEEEEEAGKRGMGWGNLLPKSKRISLRVNGKIQKIIHTHF